MRLLVSVRDAVEARAAVEGGADFVDAKEPLAGALGPVPLATLASIADALPPALPLSVALGDLRSTADVRAALRALPLRSRPGGTYVKFAIATVASTKIEQIVRAAVEAADEHPAAPRVIIAAYADEVDARTAPPVSVMRAASRGGAFGVLLDTVHKNGGTLLDALPMEWLTSWVSACRVDGFLTAIAGSMTLETLRMVATTGAHVVGVRTAACEGGRHGRVSAARVRALRDALGAVAVGAR
jgi:uncharacterized protein (UPF0264 family)